jgi:hypothetical protein
MIKISCYQKVLVRLLLFGALCGTSVLSYGQHADQASSEVTPVDSFDIKSASFLLPQALPKGKYYQTFSVLYLVLPRDWVTQVIKVPVFCYSGKYTLPYGFNLQGSLTTLVVSNRLNLGPFWNYSFNDKYHLALGYQVAFNYGFLNEFGFHTTLTGWEQQPSVTLGYSFKTMALIFRYDLYWSNGFDLSDGKNVVSNTTSYINGYSFNLSLEQRLWKNRILATGFKLYNCKYNFTAWPAFPVNSYRYWFPEFQLTLEF